MHRKALAVVYAAFLARGMFYCLLLPMWEGYDEWAHFACVQQIAGRGTLPSRNGPVSGEVRASLALAPLARRPTYRPPGGLTHEEFWRAPDNVRRARLDALRSLTPERAAAFPSDGGARNYEAQQPPLYYLVLAPVYLAARHEPLGARVLWLRAASLLIASATIPLAFAVARRVFSSGRMALAAAALIALLPELFIDVCRVGNECLAIVLISAVVLVSVRLVEPAAGLGRWAVLGFLLGAACLTKAYAVALLPVIAAVAIIRRLRLGPAPRKALSGGLLALIGSLFIAGWWYWQTWMRTGTISGEQNEAVAAHLPLAQKIAAVRDLNWLQAVDTAAFTHIWVGGWSFLVVRSWMYRVFEAVAAAAAAGLLALAWRAASRLRRGGRLGPLAARAGIAAAVYGLLCAVLAYQSLAIFLATGVSFGGGWYLYAVVAPEVVLGAGGFAALAGPRRAVQAVAAVAVLAAALDVYTTGFVLAPYYTGFAHTAPRAVPEMLRRIQAGWPTAVTPGVVAGAWIGYLAGTAALVAIALRLGWVRASVRRRRTNRFPPANRQAPRGAAQSPGGSIAGGPGGGTASCRG